MQREIHPRQVSVRSFARNFGSGIVAVLGTWVIFGEFDFRYRVIGDEPYDPVKLALHAGVLVGLFYIARWLFDRLLESRPGDEQ